jgi:predicted nucleotidyltransferase
MKAAGIITEYNPFHNGHKYHIREARRITGADYIIAVMSGNFVQRGAPALIDKYSRAMMALQNGADIVIELPACYATGSAEYFALGAVSLLDRLGVVDYLCFGSESGDIGLINEAARLLHIASEYIDEQLPHLMRKGLTYPAARARALEGYLSSEHTPDRLNTYGDADNTRKLLSNIISEPNNILGVEYVRALNEISSSIEPVTIQRVCSHYHDRRLAGSSEGSSVSAEMPGRENEAYSSATSIRSIIESARDIFGIAPVINSVPEDVYALLTENYNKTYPVTLEDFSAVIRYKLLHEDKDGLSSYLDINPDLAERILNLTNLNMSMSDLIKKLKSRNLTQTRINRALIHLLLSIREDDVREYRKQGFVYYARILGIKKSSTPLLRKIINLNQIPVITKMSKAAGNLDPVGKRMLKGDILAAHIYNQAVYEKFGVSIPNEYRHGICMI